MSWLDSDIVPIPAPPKPNRPAESEPIYRGPRGGGFLDGVFVAAIVAAFAFAAFWYATRERSDDGEQIDVDRLAVLIVEETANRDQLSVGQLAALQSPTVRDMVKAKGGEIRVLDADDKTDALGEPWPTLRRRATLRPPLVVIAARGRAVEFALPDAETLKKRIEDFRP